MSIAKKEKTQGRERKRKKKKHARAISHIPSLLSSFSSFSLVRCFRPNRGKRELCKVKKERQKSRERERKKGMQEEDIAPYEQQEVKIATMVPFRLWSSSIGRQTLFTSVIKLKTNPVSQHWKISNS